MNPLERLIEDLRAEASACRTRANLLDARIQGLEEARKFLETVPQGNGSAAPRKPRRNIRALVAELRKEPQWMHASPDDIAKELGIRARQVRPGLFTDE